jgi:hypothetical protein
MDYESDSPNPYTCNPTQLAALAIHPRTLDIVEDSYFNSLIRPEDIDSETYYRDHEDTIKWHANNQKVSAESVYQSWRDAPKEKIVFQNFCDYLNKYHNNRGKSRTIWSAPIVMGYNIMEFDWVILNRWCQKYNKLFKGKQGLFYNRDKIDLINYSWM